MRFFLLMFVSLHLFMVSATPGTAQRMIGFHMKAGDKKVEIPFEEYSNLIAIPIKINDFVTLKFILDTGAESAILTEKVYGDILGLNYVRDISVQGAGIIDTLSAFVATDIHMSLPGGVTADGMNMLVLKEDYLELNKHLGEEIYGIIGYDIFSRFVVQIDYEAKIITLYRPETYRPTKSAEKVPIKIIGGKPFMQSLVTQNGQADSVNLMVDTGASHALLLDVKTTDQIHIPETLMATRLGQGLGGEIPGFMGRMSAFTVNCYDFENILVSIPIDGAYLKAIKRGSRHGTIGGDLLTRFNVTIDYQHENIYLSKSRRYRQPFEHDMSGIKISVQGQKLDSMMISDVRRVSPANKAGIEPGDMIISINGTSAAVAKVSEFHAMLRSQPGKKIRMKLLREGEKIKVVFRLKRFI